MTDVPLTFPAILVRIFDQQQELMENFREIEQLPAAPLPIHTGHAQRILKDFAWRTTEELTEAFVALLRTTDELESKMHCGEELADAMHFMVELLIFAGVTPQQCLTRVEAFPKQTLSLNQDQLERLFWRVTLDLGVAMNFLRNRPWKRRPQPTDEGRFRLALLEAFTRLIELWTQLGYTQEDMLGFYLQKHDVNLSRQRSGV